MTTSTKTTKTREHQDDDAHRAPRPRVPPPHTPPRRCRAEPRVLLGSLEPDAHRWWCPKQSHDVDVGCSRALGAPGRARAQRVVRSQAFWSFDRFDDPPHHDYHDDAEVVSSPKRKRQRGWSLLSRAKASVSEGGSSTRKSSSSP